MVRVGHGSARARRGGAAAFLCPPPWSLPTLDAGPPRRSPAHAGGGREDVGGDADGEGVERRGSSFSSRFASAAAASLFLPSPT